MHEAENISLQLIKICHFTITSILKNLLRLYLNHSVLQIIYTPWAFSYFFLLQPQSCE